uniref:Uncharacterized protein n=1 Tax=viral metagenome TaxID=1070528 RepID=A0A2V0RIQ7_9ZZZZ
MAQRRAQYDMTCRGDCAAGVPSAIMICMKLAAAALFNVNVPPELVFISPGDDNLHAFDKMVQTQLFPGRVPCGMSLWVFPPGIVCGDAVGLAGTYFNPNETIELLTDPGNMVLTGDQIQTVGASTSTPGAGVAEPPELVGGPGMLGHGAALLRIENATVADFNIATSTVGQNVPMGGPTNLAAMADMYSARTAVNPNAALAAANVPYMRADELFADIDLTRGGDLQMIVNQPTSTMISQALQGNFSTFGSRFMNVAVTNMTLNLARNVGNHKRRKITWKI